MKVQRNDHTSMWWVYIPTKIVRFLGLNKGDDVEFTEDETTKKVEFKKVTK